MKLFIMVKSLTWTITHSMGFVNPRKTIWLQTMNMKLLHFKIITEYIHLHVCHIADYIISPH